MKFFLITILSFCSIYINAQTVKNTSYTTQKGEKVLRVEIILPINKLETWKLFTVDEQLVK
jgi:hypothetical protein